MGRAVIDRETIHHADIVPLLDTEYPDARLPQQKFGFRALLGVPLMREDRAIGAIALWRMEARRFTDKQIALVKTFADQAAIAIENVRLFKRDEGSSRATNCNERHPAGDQPVANGCAARLRHDCSGRVEAVPGRSANVFTFDGQLIHLAAVREPVNVVPTY